MQSMEQELEDRKQFAARNKQIAALINPLPQSQHGIDIELRELHRVIEHYSADYGMELNPDFQRGHVWTREQQIAFIESWLRGAVGDQGRTIIFNCPDFAGRTKAKDCDLDGLVCVDGLQRITAVMDFMDNKFRVFTNPDVPELVNGLDYDYFTYTQFSMRSKRLRFEILTLQKKVDVLNYYLSINSGGTQHSEAELKRVRDMRSELNS